MRRLQRMHSSSQPSPINVAAALIFRERRILLTQRSPSRDYGWAWESPGGKLEPGESLVEALARELHEELGVTCDESQLRQSKPWLVVSVSELLNQHRPARVHFFVVDIANQCPMALDAVGIGWFTLAELMHLHVTPANAAVRACNLFRELPGFYAV